MQGSLGALAGDVTLGSVFSVKQSSAQTNPQEHRTLGGVTNPERPHFGHLKSKDIKAARSQR
jgi:hypothetical protein